MKTALIAIATLLLSTVQSLCHAEILYTVVDLGTLGGSTSSALGINDNGQIIGLSMIAGDSDTSGFIYNAGVMTDLGAVGGVSYHPSDINDNGQVVGHYTNDHSQRNAFLYDGIVMRTIEGMASAHCISNNGEIVGEVPTPTGRSLNIFIYDGSVMTDCGSIGSLGGERLLARNINNNGYIVGGNYTSENSDGYAFLYDGTSIQDLGNLGGTYSHAHGINGNGWIVGVSHVSGDLAFHAFLYDGATMMDIGTLGGTSSVARSINNNGQVVGLSLTDPNSAWHAFLYDKEVMLDLNSVISSSSGWILIHAADINSSGQIVGAGTINGENHAFLLNPVPKVTVASPNGGERYLTNRPILIEYTTQGDIASSNVDLKYSSDNGSSWIAIATEMPNTGFFEWTTPDIESEQCLIRISSSSNPTISDMSDDTFILFNCSQVNAADLDSDCYVNLDDFSLFVAEWLWCGDRYNPECDVQ